MSIRIIIVRHGERLDEADRREWHRIRTRENQHDPPLTVAGWDQASIAGLKITALLKGVDSRVTIYSSPTARTLTTAAALVGKLHGRTASVIPVYALNCSAAAQNYGVVNGFPKERPQEDILRGVSLECWPPLGDGNEVDRRQGRGGGFVEAVKELAASHCGGDVLVMVSHREGIWQILEHVSAKMKSGYCNISEFSYDPATGALTGLDPVASKQPHLDRFSTPPRQAGQRTPSTPTRFANVSQLVGKALGVLPSTRATQTTLEEVLQRGSGMVVLHRRGRHGGTDTLLWQTPGVRGVWVNGSSTPDGEVVELLSSPMSSEGNEGDFVRVRKASGVEGWTKVRNVQLQAE